MAVANGTATITATAADGSKKKAACKVTVKLPSGGNTNTSTECQHNWKEHVVTKTIIVCNGCGATFATNEEFDTHGFQMSMNGDENHHSCGVDTINTVDYEYCTKCGAKRNVQ